MQILYTVDLNRQNPDEALSAFWEKEGIAADARPFTERLVHGVSEHAVEIDAVLKSCAKNWDIARMSKTDRNVMRMAIYELLHCEDIPPVVTINEAVDIAKRFGDSQSGKFVNGILDRIRKDLKRPAREAARAGARSAAAPRQPQQPSS